MWHALDIETTGLDPSVDELLAVGFHNGDDTIVLGRSIDLPEAHLLAVVEEFVGTTRPDSTLVTWNGGSFDMPFLAQRFLAHGVDTTLALTPTGRSGKYGDQIYRATWGDDRRHWDIAYTFEDWAAGNSVKWSLKPVARAILGIEPVEVDRTAMSTLPTEVLSDYLRSDVEITWSLAMYHLERYAHYWLADEVA